MDEKLAAINPAAVGLKLGPRRYPVIISDVLWEYLKLGDILGKDAPKIVPLSLLTKYLICRDYLIKGENNIQINLDSGLSKLLKLRPGQTVFPDLVMSLDSHKASVKEQNLHPKIETLEEFFGEIRQLQPRPISRDKVRELKEKWNALGLRPIN